MADTKKEVSEKGGKQRSWSSEQIVKKKQKTKKDPKKGKKERSQEAKFKGVNCGNKKLKEEKKRTLWRNKKEPKMAQKWSSGVGTTKTDSKGWRMSMAWQRKEKKLENNLQARIVKTVRKKKQPFYTALSILVFHAVSSPFPPSFHSLIFCCCC